MMNQFNAAFSKRCGAWVQVYGALGCVTGRTCTGSVCFALGTCSQKHKVWDLAACSLLGGVEGGAGDGRGHLLTHEVLYLIH